MTLLMSAGLREICTNQKAENKGESFEGEK